MSLSQVSCCGNMLTARLNQFEVLKQQFNSHTTIFINGNGKQIVLGSFLEDNEGRKDFSHEEVSKLLFNLCASDKRYSSLSTI